MAVPSSNPRNSGNFRSLQASTRTQIPGAKIKIGQILIEAGLLDQVKLGECLAVAAKTSQPVGRIVSMLNYAGEQDVESALIVQTLIATKKLQKERAIYVLKEAARRKIAVIELLKIFGSGAPSAMEEAEVDLGFLLTESHLVAHKTLEEAIQMAEESSFLLGKSLLLSNALTVSTAGKALQALALVRACKLSKEQAVAALAEVRKSGCSLIDAIKKMRVALPGHEGHMLLGELVARCGLATDMQILGAVEVALLQNKRLGETLIESGVITPQILKSALEIQDLAAKSVIPVDKALLVFHKLVHDNITLAQLGSGTELFEDRSASDHEVLATICSCGIVSNDDVVNAVRDKADYKMGPVRALLATGRLAPALYRAAQDYMAVLQEGRVNEADGKRALRLCAQENISFGAALASMGRSPVERKVNTPAEFSKNQPSTETLQTQIKQIVSSSVFIKLLILLVVAPVAAILWYNATPEPIDMYGVWTILGVAGGLLMLMGFSFKHSERDAAKEAYEQVENARQTKVRLTKWKK
jgi:hypothetical protein